MLTDEAAELLIDHQINTLNRSHVECLCGWYLEPTPKVEYAGLLAVRFYREHLAELVAARVRAARAQGWEDGARDVFVYFHQEQRWLQQDTDQRPTWPKNPHQENIESSQNG